MIIWIILALAIGVYLGMTVMACMVMAKRADTPRGMSLPTMGSHATNPFQVRDDCGSCNGAGMIGDRICYTCGGPGYDLP